MPQDMESLKGPVLNSALVSEPRSTGRKENSHQDKRVESVLKTGIHRGGLHWVTQRGLFLLCRENMAELLGPCRCHKNDTLQRDSRLRRSYGNVQAAQGSNSSCF